MAEFQQNPARNQKTFRLGLFGLLLVPGLAFGSFVEIQSLSAVVDVGGYVESADGDFFVSQPCPCSTFPNDRIVSSWTRGGASIEASAGFDFSIQPDTERTRFFRFVNEATAIAEVDEELGGLAGAFAWIDLFNVTYQITSDNVFYSGTTPLWDASGNLITSGSFIGAGGSVRNSVCEPG